jgi:hypothetical protein
MNKRLAKTIRLISSKGKSDFVSSLKEEIDNRLNDKVVDFYARICESLYETNTALAEENSSTSVAIINESVEKPIVTIISSLQESIRDEKTIIHNFMNGDTIAITHEDSRCLVNLHDSLNRINQEKMRKLMSENYSEYNKILQFSKKYTERTQK